MSLPTASDNPLFEPSPLPYHVPPFDRIRDEHFSPAFAEAMRKQLAEIASIANDSALPTFENTLVGMERSGQMLMRVMLGFSAVASANTNATLQSIQADVWPKLAAHTDAIYLNSTLFARVKSVYDQRNALGLDDEQRALADRYYRTFVRAGAQLSADDKRALEQLNQEEASLTTQFQTRLLAAAKAGAVVIDDKAELAGLSNAELSSAADAAAQRSLADKWVLSLHNTTQQPLSTSLNVRATREKLFKASIARSEQGDANDTREIVRRMGQLRAQKANLLGFATYASYSLDDQMAKTPDAAIRLLTELVPAATARARREVAAMQAIVDRENGGFTLAPWDWLYYAEKVRREQYSLDEAQIKPYLEVNRVLEDGVLFAATQLYGLTFKERHDLPVYHPDVRIFEVFEADGAAVALMYFDLFTRDNKNGGAWMDALVVQSKLLGDKPVICNVSNFAKPSGGQPALLTFHDVITMFHEFGHALHGFLSNVTYPTLSGTNVPRDLVELPSQFNEHWATEPEVFARYAKHWETGAPAPKELLEKIRNARAFNQGFATTEYLAAALLDMTWYTQPLADASQDIASFEHAALARYNVDVAEIPPRYRSTYFLHIFSNGYGAGYYAYLWAEVLDHDAYYWFKDHGGMSRENGQRFREMILSRGATQDPAEMYRAFAGRDPSIEPLLHERGLKT